MCGLVGIVSKTKGGFFHADKTIFLQMLISDMFRGMDSTGVFGVNRYGNLKMVKDASSPMAFINKKAGGEFFNEFVSDYHIVVGHNRKATMGAVIEENAHPFIEGNICLVHNGTLTNHHKLANRVVDSNAVAAHINEHGYKSLLKNIEGAYALIWYNAEEKILYFCRNAERPLHYVETADKIYLASEPKMLDWILDRNNIGKYTIQNVPTDKVFKFNLKTCKMEAEHKPKKEPTGRPQQNQSHPNQHQTSGYGALALAYSSDRLPEASNNKVATIETYKSSQTVYVKVVDFDINDQSTKLICETLDGFKIPGTIYVQHSQWTQVQIDKLINATALLAKIASVTSKRGVVSLWFSNIQHDYHWHDRNGQKIMGFDVYDAGNCCYCCGKEIATEDAVKWSDMTLNSQNQIMYVLCEDCADSHTNPRHNYMH